MPVWTTDDGRLPARAQIIESRGSGCAQSGREMFPSLTARHGALDTLVREGGQPASHHTGKMLGFNVEPLCVTRNYRVGRPRSLPDNVRDG
jgi:hypothetical protein